MSISSALNNALSGLTATSRMAEVVSSNLSNALTEGYGRRTVELSSAQVGGVGAGVQVDAITRHVDAGILADRRLADAALGGEQRNVDTLTRLEQAIGSVDDAASLGARLAEFENALISASSDPASELRLQEVISRLDHVVNTLASNAQSVQSLRQDADAAIANDIETLNTALGQVEILNSDILRVSSQGQDPSALLDARQRVVDDISEIIPIRQLDRDNGTIGIMTISGTTLLDSRAVEFGFERTPTITADMTFTSGALSGVTVNGEPASLNDSIGRLDGGSLGAAFALRDQTLPEVQKGLDIVAADLIARFADSANDPTLGAGNAGLLTDTGAAFDPANLVGLSSRLTINAAVDPGQGGNVTLLRDGINSGSAGPSGDATQLDRWFTALSAIRADLSGISDQSAAGRIADLSSTLSTMRLRAEETLSFTSARWDSLHETELASGVDTDQELQTLLRIEQAYAANARIMQTVDTMIQRLMEL